MAIKIYRPADSLQVYIKDDTKSLLPRLATATHLRVYPLEDESVKIVDELKSEVLIGKTVASTLQDEAGASIGADFDTALLYLAKIIG